MTAGAELKTTTAALAIIAARLAEACDRVAALNTEAEALDAQADEMDASATTPDELESVAAIRREAEAKRREALLVQAEIPGLECELRVADVAVTGAHLVVFRADRDTAHTEVLAAMETLGCALAKLLAPDLILDAAVGERFSFDPREHPPSELWRARPLIAALLDAIPARFRPADFGETVALAAEALARKEVQYDE